MKLIPLKRNLPRSIRRCFLLFCFILSAATVSSCSNDGDSSQLRTEMWGVFKTWDGNVMDTGGEASEFSVCNESFRSTASNIELNLWTMKFWDNKVTVYDTTNDSLVANGTVMNNALILDSVDGVWSFTAAYRKAGCCFDGTDGSSLHWHGVRMLNSLAPTTIGKNACDSSYTNWFDKWTGLLYSGSTVVVTQVGPTEYTIIGDSGPVLAFMHGGPGDYYSTIAYFPDLIGQGFRILTWSRPGCLRTPLSTGETPEAQADALAALLDTLSIDRVAVIGGSAGGPPAYQFAIRHPDRTWALVQAAAISRAYLWSDVERPGIKTWAYLLEQDSGMWLYNAMFEYANLGTARQFIGITSLLDDEQNDALAESVVADETKLNMLRNIFLSMAPSSLLKVGTFNDVSNYADMAPMPLEEITAPTLIVHGTADGDVPPEDAVYAASKIAGSELYWVEGGVHVFTLSKDSDMAINRILEFLNQHSPK